ncbi:MAG: SDR family oxidoreductase [Nitrospira sp.]|nr:SDR family oxidoreductase [Nitrospira sp.]
MRQRGSMPPSVLSNARPAPSRDAASPSTVLVTGGSRGIGRAICLEFGRAGWRVGVHYRGRQAEAERTAALIKDCGGEAVLCRADIRDAEQVRAMVRDLAVRWGRLDVAVCNAGEAASGLVLKLSAEQWAAAIETNLTGAFHCLQAIGSVMSEQQAGSVVVVASFAGLQGDAGQSAYAASKAGLMGLVKTAAREWGSRHVRVNAICPGWQRTDLSGTSMPEDAAASGHVLGDFVEMESVAKSVYHLALAQGASGQVWNLDSRILASI